MFKHILIPTDGSTLTNHMLGDCMRLAKSIGASVTGVTVIAEFRPFAYEAEMLPDVREEYEAESLAAANKYLYQVEEAASSAGVPYDSLSVISNFPYEAIIQAARDKQCDLIAMASHGRKGVKGFLLGSETQKVLTHSQIPVLVFR